MVHRRSRWVVPAAAIIATAALTTACGGDSGSSSSSSSSGEKVTLRVSTFGKFVNLQDHGSNDLKANWLPWKYENATTADGKRTIGLGTDVGGLAMCYRRDLFAKAGLPT